jgi:hypothetical protein
MHEGTSFQHYVSLAVVSIPNCVGDLFWLISSCKDYQSRHLLDETVSRHQESDEAMTCSWQYILMWAAITGMLAAVHAFYHGSLVITFWYLIAIAWLLSCACL